MLIINVLEFQFVHIFTNICYFPFLKITWSGITLCFWFAVLWLLMVFKHLFTCLLLIYMLSLKKYLFKSFFFSLFFYCWFLRFLYIFWTQTPYQIYYHKYFHPFCGYCFTFLMVSFKEIFFFLIWSRPFIYVIFWYLCFC